MRKLIRKATVGAVSVGLFTTSWVLLGVFALGNRFVEPIPRTKTRGDYV